MGVRYNESADTFSFALVLLCLAVGDVDYVRKLGKFVSTSTYATGWRPAIPAELDSACPDLAKLISEMWDHDIHKRPPLKAVVPRIEAASSADLDDFVPNIGREDVGVVAEEEDHAAAIAALRSEIVAQAATIATQAAKIEAQAAKIEAQAAKIGFTR